MDTRISALQNLFRKFKKFHVPSIKPGSFFERASAFEPGSSILYKRVARLMGNRFEITVVHNDSAFVEQSIEAAIAEIKRIEKLLTTFDESSQTNLVNRMAGIEA